MIASTSQYRSHCAEARPIQNRAPGQPVIPGEMGEAADEAKREDATAHNQTIEAADIQISPLKS